MERFLKNNFAGYSIPATLAVTIWCSQAGGEFFCREYTGLIRTYLENRQNPDFDKKAASVRLGALAAQAENEWPSERAPKLFEIRERNIESEFEKQQFLLNSYGFCRRGGPDYLLRDALEKAVLRAQAARRK